MVINRSVRKMCRSLENVSQSRKWITIRKMGQVKKDVTELENVSQLEKWVTVK